MKVARQSTRDQIAEAIYNAKSKADAYAAADALLAHSPMRAKRGEIARAICEAMDDRVHMQEPYPRCPDGSECACWGAADRVIALTALGCTLNLDAARDKILTHWRNRFPTNAYAWPGAPDSFASEAVTAVLSALHCASSPTSEQVARVLMADELRKGAVASLRAAVLRRHVRMASGGGEVPNGGSCSCCKQHWGADDIERHTADCALLLAEAALSALEAESDDV